MRKFSRVWSSVGGAALAWVAVIAGPVSVHAKPVPTSGIRSMTERFQDVRQNCLERDFSQTICGVFKAPLLYQRDIFDKTVVDLVFDTVDYATDGIYGLRRIVKSAFEEECPAGSSCTGRDALAVLESELKQAFANQPKLMPCQQVCMTKCVASHAFDYQIDWHEPFFNEEFALEKGYGDCKAYSKLFDRLLGDLGVPSLTVSKIGPVNRQGNIGGHEFNLVQVKERWFAMDPTLDQCAFIDVDHPQE